MAIIKSDNDYADVDFLFLKRHLQLLDLELAPLNAKISITRDPESAGLCDQAEYFIGQGFVAIQRYLITTKSVLGVNTADAFNTPPQLTSTVSFVTAINVGANYWKHVEEWIEIINKTSHHNLTGQARKTLLQIEEITPWAEYTCSNLLAILLKGQSLNLSLLLPKIEEWRNNLFAHL
ncbi:MAG: hypothetical protein ABF443_14570 [Acetobacter malorum]|uniref:hypothetical protein n=1 Tax=Acetobacter malorum TaxID=178901 RepID=UPI0039E7D779